MRICIDPGHGGDNPGNPGGGMVSEKFWTLHMAKILGDLLQYDTHQITYTRDRDATVSHSERAKIARDALADIVISLHTNAAIDASGNVNPKPRGLMAFYRLGDPVGQFVADAIQRRAPHALQRNQGDSIGYLVHADKDPKDSPYPGVVTCTRLYTCPVVLVECGYATSPRDILALDSETVCVGIAHAIAAAVADYDYSRQVKEAGTA